MSGLYSNTSNYGGRQPDNTAYVKQFVNTVSGYANWIFKTIDSIRYITPAVMENVYLPKDLIVAGSIISPSDRELKEDIDNLSNEFCDDLLLMEPKQYKYKNDTNKKVRYGFIAQEIENVFPDLVNKGDMYKSINYLDLIPIMVCKIKKMQKQIDELQQESLKLKSKKDVSNISPDFFI